MTLDEYQQKAISTLTQDHDYGDFDAGSMAQVLGLVGDSGEVADKVKKIIRDGGGKLTGESKLEILKEVGDVLWYVNAVAVLLGSSLEKVAEQNVIKLASRQARNQIHGSGDNR